MYRPTLRLGERFAGVAIVAALVMCADAARAQPAAEAPDTSTQPAPPAEPQQDIADTADIVATYEQGFRALLGGDLPRAQELLRAVADRAKEPDRRASARELARLAGELIARGARIATASPTDGQKRVQRNRYSSPDDAPDAGRASAVISSTLMGTYAGVVSLDLLDIGDLRPGVLLVMGGTAAGLVGSLYATRGRTITSGMADAYSLGMSIGLANGLLLAFPVGLDGSSESVQGVALGSLVLGGGAGLLISHATRPTRAQVGFTGTVAALGAATAGLGLAVLQPDLSSDTVLLLLAGGVDVGAGAGLGIAANLNWSNARQRLVTLGAFIGAIGGWGIAALTTGADVENDSTGRTWGASTLVGIWGGFGLAMHLTRDMKPDARFAPDKAPQTNLMPTMIRGAPGLAVAGQF